MNKSWKRDFSSIPLVCTQMFCIYFFIAAVHKYWPYIQCQIKVWDLGAVAQGLLGDLYKKFVQGVTPSLTSLSYTVLQSKGLSQAGDLEKKFDQHVTLSDITEDPTLSLAY